VVSLMEVPIPSQPPMPSQPPTTLQTVLHQSTRVRCEPEQYKQDFILHTSTIPQLFHTYMESTRAIMQID